MFTRKLCASVAVLAVLLSIGCYSTRFKLIEPSQATVDRALCGAWAVEDAENPSSLVTLHVRNLDDHQYLLDWQNELDGKSDHYVGFVGEVNGVRFMHARPLPPDGSVSPNHLLIRFEMKDDVLTMRHVSKEFMDGQTVDSDASLRKVLAENLESDDLYVPKTQTARRLEVE